jgi:hypothetical protein
MTDISNSYACIAVQAQEIIAGPAGQDASCQFILDGSGLRRE